MAAGPSTGFVAPRLAGVLAAVGPTDLALTGWVAAGQPLLHLAGIEVTGTYGALADRHDPLLGLAYAVAIALGVLSLALRATPGSPEAIARADEFGIVFGPFTGGVLLLGVIAAQNLGLPGPSVVVTVAALGLVVLVLSSRLPVPGPDTRRLLIEPYVFLAAGLFNATMAEVTPGLAFGGVQANGPSDVLAALGLTVGIVALFSSVFYAMLVYAPRQLADPRRGLGGWIARYALFVAGVVVGSSWLRALGS
jgi:hypothetical protein